MQGLVPKRRGLTLAGPFSEPLLSVPSALAKPYSESWEPGQPRRKEAKPGELILKGRDLLSGIRYRLSVDV